MNKEEIDIFREILYYIPKKCPDWWDCQEHATCQLLQRIKKAFPDVDLPNKLEKPPYCDECEGECRG